MQEKPLLPKQWRAEKGASMAGSTHMKWAWNFSGPRQTEDKAKEAIESFLEGFTWWYKGQEPPK